jgi:uncharacterized surface protein with fasciclin (FAS1) repeats
MHSCGVPRPQIWWRPAGVETLKGAARNVVVRDANGGVADISTYDVTQLNGVIHVLDRVLLPR